LQYPEHSSEGARERVKEPTFEAIQCKLKIKRVKPRPVQHILIEPR